MFNKLWSLIKEIHYDQRGGTGAAVATDETITAAKMNLKLENYDLIDDEELLLGTGDDWKVTFDGAKVLITLASQFSHVLTGGHFSLETLEDDKQIRLNVRDFANTSGDSIGFMTRPRANASGTQSVYGCQIAPGVNDTIGLNSIIGALVDIYLKGSSGILSGDLRAFQGQITDENVAGRTISGISSILDAWQQLAAHTFTGGVYVVNVRAAGGATPWSGLMKLPDDSQIAAKGTPTATLPANTAWIRVKVGDTFVKIACYAN